MKVLIVGAGLYGCVMANMLKNVNIECKIIDKRNHIAGNIYTKKYNDIDIHMYGPHIFHTSNNQIIQFITQFGKFENFNANMLATDGINLYHLPFNMTTFCEFFGYATPNQIKEIINNEIEQSGLKNKEPVNLEEKAIKLVGTTIYNKLIKNYTEKQWNKSCKELSPDIITRLPLRFIFDNNYYYDSFVAIPKDGYTSLIENMIKDIPVELNVNFLNNIGKYISEYTHIIYCGCIDELLEYQYGELEWRSLSFEHYEQLFDDTIFPCFQLNDITKENKWTRTINHLFFKPSLVNNYKGNIILTKEYPQNWKRGKECYYPINNEFNNNLYNKYIKLLKSKYPNIIPGGRLGKYKYFDMDVTILEAMNDFKLIFNKNGTS